MSGSQQAMLMAIPTAAVDTSFASVVALIQPADADNSTTFADLSSYAHAITVRGQIKQSTEQQVNGLNGIECDGNGDALRLAANAAFVVPVSGDFTIECFVRFNTVTARQIFLGFNGSSIAYFDMHRNTNSKLVWAGSGDLYEFNQTLSTNTWYHIAVSRDGTDILGFVDGVTRFSGASSTSGHSGDSGNGFEIGALPVIAGDSLGLNGYITQIRYTVGIARYTLDFTPPSSPFPES